MAETNLNELITSYRQNLEYNKKDDELIIAINRAIGESVELKNQIDKIGEVNKRYWQFGSNRAEQVHPKKSKAGVNRIFTDVETAIPILSANTPEPTIMGNVSNEIREKLDKALEIAYEVKYKIQQKLQCLIRHWFLFRIGIWKYRWDRENGFVTENVIPRKVGIDKRATTKANCEYIWEEMEDTAENLIGKFPKKEKDILAFVNKDNQKSKVKYFEFWGGGGEWVCWVIPARNLILEKKWNPNFDYDDENRNLLKRPEFPYIFLNVFNIGDETSLYDETSLIEECIPAQDGVNQLERQIIDLNEGQKRVWVTSGEAMSEKKAQDLVDKTGDLMVYLDRKAPLGGLTQVQSGKPDASLYNNLSHLLSEIDNIMGIHSTTRGERAQQETYGGRQLLMAADIGRMDMIVRNVEQVMEEWFNAMLHMLKVYSIENVSFNSVEESVEISAEEIPAGIIIMVKKGSTLPTDDRTRMDMAKELASANMIDPKTLFEEMGYANVDERVQALYQWLQMTGKIAPQQPPVQQGVPQGGQAGTQAGQEGQAEQLTRLQGILQSPQFQQLPPEEQQEFLQRGRQIVEQVKSGV